MWSMSRLPIMTHASMTHEMSATQPMTVISRVREELTPSTSSYMNAA